MLVGSTRSTNLLISCLRCVRISIARWLNTPQSGRKLGAQRRTSLQTLAALTCGKRKDYTEAVGTDDLGIFWASGWCQSHLELPRPWNSHNDLSPGKEYHLGGWLIACTIRFESMAKSAKAVPKDSCEGSSLKLI